MTQREIDLEHELSTALRKVDEQSELLRLCKEENEEKRKDILWTMGERAKLMDRIKRLEESENRMLNWLTEDCPEAVKKQLSNAWMKSKEAKP